MEVALIIIVAYLLVSLFNSWSENARRVRCRARSGLFGTCGVPVADGLTRCALHRGLPPRRWP